MSNKAYALYSLLVMLVTSVTVAAAPSETPREVSGSALITLEENTLFVANFIVQDERGGQLTLTLEGEDAALFQLDAGTLSFIEAPDFEQPSDFNHNNIYTLRVNARDEQGAPSAIDLQLVVNNINEAPVFSNDANHVVFENTEFAIQLIAADDEADDFSFGLAGEDAAFFSLDDGWLALNTELDFEQPADTDQDNRYLVTLEAIDSQGNIGQLELVLVVQNQQELGYFTGLSPRIIYEIEASGGNTAPLFAGIEWIDPDGVFTGHRLDISGHLVEDNIVVVDVPSADLNYIEETGQITIGERLVAVVDLVNHGAAGNKLSVEFNSTTTSSDAQAVLSAIQFFTTAILPELQRQITVQLTDHQGFITRVVDALTFVEAGLWSPVSPPPDMPGNSFTHLADIDKDGIADLLLGKSNGTMALHLGLAEASDKSSSIFSWETTAAGLLSNFDVGDNAVPAAVDIDGDGDLDIFVGNALGFVSYFENTSSGDSLSFSNRIGRNNPLSNIDVGEHARPFFLDIDSDKDADLLLTNLAGEVLLYNNIGTANQPRFELNTLAPFDTDLLGGKIAISSVDLDTDGDVDLVIGHVGASGSDGDVSNGNKGKISYFENVGSAYKPDFQNTQMNSPFQQLSFADVVIPHFIDVDGDGDKDSLLQTDASQMSLIENQSRLTVSVVRRENSAPIIQSIPTTELVGNVSFDLVANVTDIDNDELTFMWQQVDGVAAVILDDTSATLSFVTPLVGAKQTLTFRLTVADGRTTSVADFSVDVYPIGTNIPGFNVPQIVLPEVLYAEPGQTVWLSAGISDLDGDELTYSWVQASGQSVELIGTDTLYPQFVAPMTTSDLAIGFRLVVSDGLFTEYKDVIVLVEVPVVVEVEPSEDKDNSPRFALSFSQWFWLLATMIIARRRLTRLAGC